MEEASVARRSAALLSEVLEVAQAYVQQRNVAAAVPEQSGMQGQPHESSQHPEGHDLSFEVETDFSRTLFSYTAPGQDAGDLLATLIDPNVLHDFTATGGDFFNQDLSTFSVDEHSTAWMGMETMDWSRRA